VFTIQKKMLSIRDTMEIERDGKRVATVMKALITPMRDRFSIEVEGGEDMEAKGDIVDHEYEIERGGERRSPRCRNAGSACATPMASRSPMSRTTR
jgi:uncharacterized protein YxjI